MSKGIHLTEYHEAVRLWLKSKAPWLKGVEYYPEITDTLETPCAFISVMGWEPVGDQPGNGQLAVNLHCEVLAVMGVKESTYQLDARNAAMFLSVVLQDTNFGIKAMPAKVVSADPDALDPELDAYSVWSIKYVQKVTIGMPTLEPDEERGIRLAVNPVNMDDPAEYHPLEDFNEANA
ncbi:hypothetical protein [Shewanella sp. SM21]|uniref:hypothetical protein n=1 Tax=Shewanella sp. SM21 TaxID=2912793 RepID=UPI0021DA0AA9|nr:hypothetical protein [Shewanella sp. SM21]MCU8086873.1 hypothetical protein [Shewanella sp. SM21]